MKNINLVRDDGTPLLTAVPCEILQQLLTLPQTQIAELCHRSCLGSDGEIVLGQRPKCKLRHHKLDIPAQGGCALG